MIKEITLFAAIGIAPMMGGLLDNTPNPLPQSAPLFTTSPDRTAEILAAKQRQADEEKRAVLRQYEQADFDVMRGVVYEPTGE